MRQARASEREGAELSAACVVSGIDFEKTAFVGGGKIWESEIWVSLVPLESQCGCVCASKPRSLRRIRGADAPPEAHAGCRRYSQV